MYTSFDALPMPRLRLPSEETTIKRLLVLVRSKRFRVYVGPTEHGDEVAIIRVLPPSQPPLEA